MNIIGATVYDPMAPSIFGKPNKNEKAECRTISCTCPDCPLLAKKECIKTGIFGGYCPYGTTSYEKGYSWRAKNFNKWIQEKKEEYKGITWPKYPTRKIAFIGDYVYLPYTHMDMCDKIPILQKSSLFINGRPFIKKDEWTLQVVEILLDFRPQAMMGGEITSYQKEEVPKFLQHLREVDPDMWAALIKKRPELDKAPDYVGRKALVKTLAPNITIPPYDKRYPVEWKWDGTYLTTQSEHVYSGTWGGHIRGKERWIKVQPSDTDSIVVKDNSWVNSQTILVD